MRHEKNRGAELQMRVIYDREGGGGWGVGMETMQKNWVKTKNDELTDKEHTLSKD